MRAIQLVKYGKPEVAFQRKELPKPEPKSDEVLIKVKAFGLNFADVLARNGLYGDAPDIPCVLGYEVVGRVEAVGDDVLNVTEGQRVVAFTRFGGYAEYVTTPERGVAILPDQVGDEEATALATQYTTAYYCTHEAVRMHEEHRVLVHAAAGGVGTALVQMAKHKGCFVFGTAGADEKLDYLDKQGVDVPINYRKADFVEKVLEHNGEERVDIIFDSVGGRIFKKNRKVLAYGGRMVCLGAADRMRTARNWWGTLTLLWQYGLLIPPKLLMQSKGLIGVNMLRLADHKPEVVSRGMQEVIRLRKEKKIKPYVGKVFPVDEIAEAHRFLENRSSMGKVVVRW